MADFITPYTGKNLKLTFSPLVTNIMNVSGKTAEIGLEIKNESSNPITLYSNNKGNVGSNEFSFCIVFPEGTLKKPVHQSKGNNHNFSTPDTIDDWKVLTKETQQGTQLGYTVYFLSTKPISIGSQQELTLNIGRLFLNRDSTSTQVTFRYRYSSTEEYTQAHFVTLDHTKAPLEMTASVHGSLLNDGSNNSFDIYLVNTSRDEIKFKKDITTLNIAYRKDENVPDALTDQTESTGNVVITNFTIDNGKEDIPESFKFTCIKDFTLKPEESIKITIKDIRTTISPRIGFVYIDHEKIDNYRDGRMIVPITVGAIQEKSNNGFLLKTSQQTNNSSADLTIYSGRTLYLKSNGGYVHLKGLIKLDGLVDFTGRVISDPLNDSDSRFPKYTVARITRQYRQRTKAASLVFNLGTEPQHSFIFRKTSSQSSDKDILKIDSNKILVNAPLTSENELTLNSKTSNVQINAKQSISFNLGEGSPKPYNLKITSPAGKGDNEFMTIASNKNLTIGGRSLGLSSKKNMAIYAHTSLVMKMGTELQIRKKDKPEILMKVEENKITMNAPLEFGEDSKPFVLEKITGIGNISDGNGNIITKRDVSTWIPIPIKGRVSYNQDARLIKNLMVANISEKWEVSFTFSSFGSSNNIGSDLHPKAEIEVLFIKRDFFKKVGY